MIIYRLMIRIILIYKHLTCPLLRHQTVQVLSRPPTWRHRHTQTSMCQTQKQNQSWTGPNFPGPAKQAEIHLTQQRVHFTTGSCHVTTARDEGAVVLSANCSSVLPPAERHEVTSSRPDFSVFINFSLSWSYLAINNQATVMINGVEWERVNVLCV